ncbi:hypothetical protein DPSP01_006138 [Paraphaeosphaeria sporulosa]
MRALLYFSRSSFSSLKRPAAQLTNRRLDSVPARPLSTTAPAMSDIKKIFAKDAMPPAGPYSHAVVAGPNIYVSGCIPADATGALVTGSIATQTQACIDNIKAILAAAGSDISRVVKVNVFLTDMADFAEMNGVYAEAFAHKPARSCVAVKQLPKGVPVEIECVAFNG